MATTLAIAVALLADAALVAAGTVLFPTTAGYEHFRFEDYAKLTVIGVLFGCAGWPILTRITSSPRWLYLRLTLLASLALLLPDAWLLMRGQPFRAVAVLVAMHVAVAVITYNLIVRLAPTRNRDPAG